jgi:hypothetical protein
MGFIGVTRRITLYVLTIPVLLIFADAVLRFFDAQLSNSLVRRIYALEDQLTPDILDTIVPEQSFLQTAAFNLLFWGIVVAFFIALFRLLESAFGSSGGRSKKDA